MGSALGSGGSILKPSESGSAHHEGSSWSLLTEAIPTALPYAQNHKPNVHGQHTKEQKFLRNLKDLNEVNKKSLYLINHLLHVAVTEPVVQKKATSTATLNFSSNKGIRKSKHDFHSYFILQKTFMRFIAKKASTGKVA